MYLFFDTETTGLPKRKNAPLSDLNNWPRLVQIAWLQYDNSGKEVVKQSYIIKPENFEIPLDAIKIHGITTEKANTFGIPLKQALSEFSILLGNSSLLVAHNVDFDEKVVGSELMRTKITTNLSSITKVCTQKTTTDFCKLPNLYGHYGYKWPSLMELHKKLFNDSFDKAHDALGDVSACAKCFFELKKRNIIKI
ncbi:MAG TPA: 3'-5' exonuclease [Candidatus Nanoarchaeia archaeon]|nr:3'-5' exonuclease [Candidatus Nanoarchaeia archaeon]